jgi:hypothetical protein
VSKKDTPEGQIAQALGIKPYQLKLWANLGGMATARELLPKARREGNAAMEAQLQAEVEYFAAMVGQIVSQRLAKGDGGICDWLAKAEHAQRLATDKTPPQIPTPSGKRPPTRHLSIMAGLDMMNNEQLKKWKTEGGEKPRAPTVQEAMDYLNKLRSKDCLPLVTKSDYSDAISSVTALKKRFAPARRGRPKKQ